MFVMKSTHDAVKAELDRVTDRLVAEREARRKINAELNEALAELAPLKAARERSVANLIAANAARKAKAVLTN